MRERPRHLWMLRSYSGVSQVGPAQLHPLTSIYGVSGCAMISATLRVPKL